MLETTWGRWMVGAIAVAAIVAILAWARNDPGVGGREPDPPTATSLVGDGDSVPPQDTTPVTDTVTSTT